MKKLVTVSQVVELVQRYNPAFTRQSVYDAIDKGDLVGLRNPVRANAHYKFRIEDVDNFTHATLGWPAYRALDLLRGGP